jgi:glutamate-1-semialdehyde 2,1-aminomutase
VFTVLYERPGAYNWMLQFYLRQNGLALSWVGSGRMVFSLDFDDAAFDEAVSRFAEAAQAMKADGWWDGSEMSNRNIRRSMLRDLLKARFHRFRAT